MSAYTVHSIRHLTPTAFVIRFDRNNLQFTAGQYITVGIEKDLHVREYSIYSSPEEDFLEILVKLVEGGTVSKKLFDLKPGDRLQVEGPFGYFTLAGDDSPVLMVASGTGISPFHSMLLQNPDINYRLLHGVRFEFENYDWNLYPSDRFTQCISKSDQADSRYFNGRVTDHLKQNPIQDPATRCFLCGNCDMIYEVFDILQKQGIPSSQLHAEVYF